MNIEPSTDRTPKSPLTDVTRYQEGLPLKVIDGTWPKDLRGHVFFTAPDCKPGVPLFGSDGMLYRFDLTARGVVVRSGSTRTPSSFAAEAAESDPRLAKWSHRFRSIGLSRLSPTLGAVECLNVAPTPVGDALWVTSDAGRPWVIDPDLLQLVEPIGGRDLWRPVAPLPWTFPLVLGSGHPAIDHRTTTVYGANFSNMASPGAPAFVDLLRLHGGALHKWRLTDAATGKDAHIHQSVHQMAMTSGHVVLLDAAFHVEPAQLVIESVRSVLPLPQNAFAALGTEAQRDESVLWVVPRTQLTDDTTTATARRYVLPGESTHFAADFDEVDGAVRVVVLHTPCQDVSEWVRPGERMVTGAAAHPDLIGLPAGTPARHGDVGVHTLHADGRIESASYRHDPFTWGPALFTQPPGNTGKLTQFWYYTAGFAPDALPQRVFDVYAERAAAGGAGAPTPRPSSVVRFDLMTRAFDGWSAPTGWGVFGLCFVPRDAGTRSGIGEHDPNDGYLFAVALSDAHEGLPEDSTGDEVWIFRALDVAAGPIARLAHRELNMPFVLHGSYVRRMRDAKRTGAVDMRADHDPDAAIDAWLATVPAPSLVKRGMRVAAATAIDPTSVRAALDEHVWPRFRR